MKDDLFEVIREVKELVWKEVNDFVKKERLYLVLGLNGVFYIVYKCLVLFVVIFLSNLEKRNNISMLEKV